MSDKGKRGGNKDVREGKKEGRKGRRVKRRKGGERIIRKIGGQIGA